MAVSATTDGVQKKPAPMRERLLEAATEVFAESGYDGAALSRIARRAGVTTGAIYANYANKAELLLEVIRARLDMQLEPYREMWERGETPDPSELFMRMTRDRLVEDRPLTRAILLETFAAARRYPEVREAVQEWLRDATGPLIAMVRQAQVAGTIDKNVHAPTLAFFFMMPGAGESFNEAAGLPLPRESNYMPLVRRMADALTRLSNKND